MNSLGVKHKESTLSVWVILSQKNVKSHVEKIMWMMNIAIVVLKYVWYFTYVLKGIN